MARPISAVVDRIARHACRTGEGEGKFPCHAVCLILGGIGFERISIRPNRNIGRIICEWPPGTKAEDYVIAASIEAVKPQQLSGGMSPK